MTPAPIANSNAVLRAPSGMENEVHTIQFLREYVEGQGCVSSAWKPDDYELMSLGQGGCVILTCMGSTMPPVIVRTTGPVCPVCSLEIKPGEEMTEGEETVAHTACLNITLAGMSEPERAALGVRALEKELSEALAHDPEYLEIRPDVFASRDDLANCFAMIGELREYVELLEKTVRLLNAQLVLVNGHNDLSKAVAAAARNRMVLEEQATIRPPAPKLPAWIARDEKAPAASGFYQVKNLDGSLSARLWEDGVWWHASALYGLNPNVSITHWLHVPLIHGDPVPAPNFDSNQSKS
jgi:hypothetical protein